MHVIGAAIDPASPKYGEPFETCSSETVESGALEGKGTYRIL
jgi:hypothetical protein